MMGASALFHSGSFNNVRVVGESVGFVQMVDLSLLSSRPRGENFFWRRARPPARGVRVTVEGEVVLINVHSRVWVFVSHLIFNGGNSCVHGQREDEALHGATLGQAPCHGVGDDITVVKLARELVPRFEEDGAPFPYVFV